MTVTEGNSGTTNATFTVTLSAASTQTVTVQYSTQNNTATAPADYTAATNQTLTFSPGTTSKPLTIAVVGDTLVEPDETFFVNLSNPTNATISVAQARGTITNDDSAGTVKDIVVVSGQTKAVEGGAGARGQIKLIFSRKSDSLLPLPVSLGITFTTVTPGESITFGNPASAGDFLLSPRPDGTDAKNAIFVTKKIQFPAGATDVEYILNVKANDGAEGLEGFQVKILTDDKVNTTDRWDHFPAPNSPTFAGNAVTAYIVDGIVLYAKDNSNAQLKDDPLPAGNPGIHANDVNQGGIGDCFLMSTLAAIAKQNPNLIKNAIQPNAADVFSYQVRLFRDVGEAPKLVSVTLSFANGYAAAEFSGDFVTAGNQKMVEVWPQVIEQAIEKEFGRGNIISGAGVGEPFRNVVVWLTGKEPLTPTTGPLANRIRTAFNSGQAVMIATQQGFDESDPRTYASGSGITLLDPAFTPPKPVKVVTHHAYAVIGVATGRIQLFDPRLKSVSSFWLSDTDINNMAIFGSMAAIAP